MTAEVGQPAPDFTLPGIAGDERRDYSLSEYRGRKVVLAFYPGDFTPGCTKQMCQYRDQFAEFEGVEAVLLGISPQDVDSHEKWIEAKQFPFPLLADTDHHVSEAYGVWGERSFAGRTFMGVERTTVIIGKDGQIKKLWPNVSVDGHVDEVLAALD